MPRGGPQAGGPTPGSMGGDGTQQVTQGMAEMTVAQQRPQESGQGDRGGDAGARGTARFKGRPRKSNDVYFRSEHIKTDEAKRFAAKGNDDKDFMVLVNFFKIKAFAQEKQYKYRVEFDPDEDNLKERSVKARSAMGTLGIPEAKWSFRRDIMYAPQPLENVDVDGTLVKFTAEQIIEMSSPELFPLLNGVFNSAMARDGLTRVMRHYFDFTKMETVGRGNDRLEVIPGFETAIANYRGGLFLNANLASKVMRTQNVGDLMNTRFGAARGDAQRMADICVQLSNELIGQVVLTPYNNKTYTIGDMDFESSPMSTFDRNGVETTYVDYFKQVYGVDIPHSRMRGMIVAKQSARDRNRKVATQTSSKADTEDSDRKVLLVPDLCNMTGMSDEMRRNFGLMKDVAQRTNRVPHVLQQTLVTFAKKLQRPGSESKALLDGFGLAFEESMTRIPARILHGNYAQSTPLIFAGRNRLPFGVNDFMKDLRSKPIHRAVPIDRWCVVSTPRDMPGANKLVQDLIRAGRGMGINVGPPQMFEVQGGIGASQWNNALSMHAGRGANWQIVLCLVPNNNAAVYQTIKKHCYHTHGIPSQVVTSKVAAKGLTVATKVVLQMDCKVGGEAWALTIPSSSIMVCGYDTYHSGAGRGGVRTSLGVFVSSYNTGLSRYYAQTFVQEDELNPNMKVGMTNALQQYRKVNGRAPSHIVVYRDGLGDGMMRYFHDVEVAPIEDSVNTFCEQNGDEVPHLVVVVVKKRINTRILAARPPRNPTDLPQVDNPPPGTVVDDVITRPHWFDFFLVSQTARQGTVSPTHYNVVWDTKGIGARVLQSLTYRLTQVYYNWTGAISVPAPCQYAHKLAYLVGESMGSVLPNVNIQDQLFYL